MDRFLVHFLGYSYLGCNLLVDMNLQNGCWCPCAFVELGFLAARVWPSWIYVGGRLWSWSGIHHWQHHRYGISCGWSQFWYSWICGGEFHECSECCFCYGNEDNFWNLLSLLQGFYRNHMEEVISFFETHHKASSLASVFIFLNSHWFSLLS